MVKLPKQNEYKIMYRMNYGILVDGVVDQKSQVKNYYEAKFHLYPVLEVSTSDGNEDVFEKYIAALLISNIKLT